MRSDSVSLDHLSGLQEVYGCVTFLLRPTAPLSSFLASLTGLGIDPETADGIASLDGNADGYTCIKPLTHVDTEAVIFRDNTVAAAH